MEYIISQIFVAVSYIFIGWSYITKNRKFILICSILSVICFAVAYFLLNAWSALAMMGVSITRNTIFLIRSNKSSSEKLEKADYVIGAFLLVIIVTLSIISYEKLYSLLSCMATLVYTFSVWQKSTLVYKICGIPTSLFWIAYNVFINSILGIILESLVVVFAIVGLALSKKQNQTQIEQSNNLNKEQI